MQDRARTELSSATLHEPMATKTEPSVLPADASDEAVVTHVLEGHGEAFEMLMRRYNALVFRAARAVVRSDAAAEDCAQQAWILAFDRLEQLHDRSGFSSWVARIAYRQALRTVRFDRSRNNLPYDELDDLEPSMSRAEPDPEREAQRSQLRTQLESTIDELPPPLREAFVLSEVQCLSARETASLLGITEQNARVRAHRARGLLRDKLGAFHPELAFAFDGTRCDRIVAAVMRVVRSR